MKVFELIRVLQSYDPTLDIIMSRDPEGNGYAPLGSIDGDNYTFVDAEVYTKEDGQPAKSERVVVIWPKY